MACYSILWKPKAEKELRALPKTIIHAIVTTVEGLAINPYPANTKKLKGTAKFYFRVRTGNYRIIYEVHNQELIIDIIEVGHRKDIYR
jgi:mRNA interferase RelE/StbE